MWTVYADDLVNADFAGAPIQYQPFSLPRLTKVKAASTFMLFYNDPVFTEMKMRIYSDKNGSAADQLFEFDNSFVPGDILLTESYGMKEIRFEFDIPKWLAKDTTYHLVPYFSGASFTLSSYVSWIRAWPDLNTDSPYSLDFYNLHLQPYWISIIGADR